MHVEYFLFKLHENKNVGKKIIQEEFVEISKTLLTRSHDWSQLVCESAFMEHCPYIVVILDKKNGI